MNRRHYGAEETDVRLPRKARNVKDKECLYRKPTQVGR